MTNKYMEIFNNPPKESKGYTRWWWYGCAVDKKGINKQLKDLKDANIGGVEVQILYPVEPDNSKNETKNIPYFSPEFFDILKYTSDKCKQLDLGFDFTLGSSWPYGGPFVTAENAMQCAIPYQIDIYGPCDYKCDLTTVITGEVTCAVMGKMEKGEMLLDSIVDITNKFKEKYLFNWPWGTEIESIKIPKGNWKLVFFVIHRYRQMVLKPARDAQGYVIDHLSKKAADLFFDNMAQPIIEKLGNDSVKSFFCDSIECDGHNWSRVLLKEFKERRGYDLSKYIYALWGDIKGITENIRYDYFLTMSELTIENFFERFTNWCNKNGSTSRTQVHGTWADVLKAYATADIPEGETFGEHDKLECNTIHRRLASSAGHLYGKNIISNETFTWLKVPRFIATLENMKAAVDAVFLDGMNMIVNHGCSYLPYNAKGRGLPFYASCHISQTNTWWPYYKHLGAYIQRVCAMLRKGYNYSEVAIFLPQADIWSDNRMSDMHLAMKLEEHLGKDVVQNISNAGYWFDYVNDEALTKLGKIVPGGIKIGKNIYKTIILIGCKRLKIETAKVFDNFVSQGGNLIATKEKPNLGCGYLDKHKKEKTVNGIMTKIFNGNKLNSYGRGRAIISKDNKANLLWCLNKVQRPDVKIEKNQVVGYVHRVDNDSHIYFTSNISESYVKCKLEFNKRKEGYEILNPETLVKKEVTDIKIEKDKVILTVEYEPFESLFFIFTKDTKLVDKKIRKKTEVKDIININNWKLTVEANGFCEHIQKLTGWQKYDELKYYSGEVKYVSLFTCDKNHLEYKEAILSFDKIDCAASVWINKKHVSDLWKSPYKLDVKKAIVEGENEITIKVVNRLINEAIDPKRKEELEPVLIDEWPYYGNVINDTRKTKVFNTNERKLIKEPMPSGIIGDVKIEFMK